MPAASKAETVTLRLEQNIDSAADAATGALGRLEAKIVREQGALGRLEGDLARARGAMALLAEGAPDAKAVAAFNKQGEAVTELEARLAEARDTLAVIAQTRVTPQTLIAAQQSASELAVELETAKAKLAELGKATGPQVNVDAYRKQAASVAAMADRVAGQKDKIAGMSEAFKKGTDAANGQKVPLAAVAKSFKMLGGEMGATESKGVRLIGLFMKMGPTIAAVVAAVIVLAGGIGIFASIVSKGISASSEMRDEMLKLESAGVTLWNSNRASAASAQQLQESIGRVAAGSALARDKIVDYATQLRNARFTGKQLETTLEAMAIAGSGGNDAMAASFLESAKAAKFFGGDVDKLAERIKTKFGAAAQAKLLSLDVQLQKLHENITWIFSGADIEPFLRGLQSIFSLFGRNEAGAKSMRDMVTKMTEWAIGGFLRLAIAMVKTYIAIKTNHTAWFAMKVVLYGILAVLGAVVALIALGMAVAAVQVALAVAPFVLFVLAIRAVINGLGELRDWWRSVNLAEVGTAMIDGLINGLKSAGSKVFATLKSIVGGAVDGVKSFLRIGSPSQLMHDDVGVQMGAGTVGGLDESAADVKAAAVNMAETAVPNVAAARSSAPVAMAAPASGDSGGKQGLTVAFYNCVFGEGTNQSVIDRMVRVSFEKANLDAAVPG